MKKVLIILIILTLVSLCNAKSLTSVSQINGNALQTMQSAWVVADSETSAGTEASALTVTERTKKIVDRLIVAASSGDDEISIFVIPSKWNTIRLRAIGITDAATRTDQIYFGTLGGRLDCELTHAAQLAWTIGTQTSIYDQITFTSGGTYQPLVGDVVTGNTSGETATIYSISALTSGTWAAGTAAGTITYTSASGVFTDSETLSVKSGSLVKTTNGLTHAASDLLAFEMADTLVRTAKSWGAPWSETSPADNTNAETEVDRKSADIMVIVTTASTVDTKLLITGD